MRNRALSTASTPLRQTRTARGRGIIPMICIRQARAVRVQPATLQRDYLDAQRTCCPGKHTVDSKKQCAPVRAPYWRYSHRSLRLLHDYLDAQRTCCPGTKALLTARSSATPRGGCSKVVRFVEWCVGGKLYTHLGCRNSSLLGGTRSQRGEWNT